MMGVVKIGCLSSLRLMLGLSDRGGGGVGGLYYPTTSLLFTLKQLTQRASLHLSADPDETFSLVADRAGGRLRLVVSANK